MHRFVFHNERVLPIDQVRLSPGQAGLLNGWGIFTTIRVYDGYPFAFERHWSRLASDAKRIDLPLPYSRDQVREQVMRVLAANHVGSGCLRIYFVNNRSAIWSSNEKFPATETLIYSIDLPLRTGAVRLGVQHHGRHAGHPLAGTKVTSWLQNVWVVEQAHHRGYEDMVLVNERNEVAECTACNLFCVRDGVVQTPPLHSGCLAGVTRQVLLEIGPPENIIISEQPLSLTDFLTADEVFITSTTRHVQPVASIDEQEYQKAPGPMTERLAQLFNNYVDNYISHSVGKIVASR